MDYDKMSDFDIAEAVLLAMGARKFNSEVDVTMYVLGEENERKDVGVGASKKFAFDPCNNPADAWPIIAEKRIAIIPDAAAGEWVAFNGFSLYEGDWMFASDPATHANGKNPLRAAMVVFLMMQEDTRD
ncbi:phage protein NinX family protein [Pluralibacter gergoviae]|uniref:phage protein NinX family protein n=1 Tax=Pluralibacter gergoviae TaxID=61647 RepID=UPI001FF683C2|nr:phage protein NinX family protein [Pluralibacter gergoviae]MCK1065029.1 DUF2591 domain-containing protein [Pluralibacter gergoviae]